MIAFTVALGVSLATAMMNVMLGVGDKVNKELKTYGANITVMHKDASILDDLYGLSGEGVSNKFLSESEVPKIKQIFWGFAIVDFAPYLERSGEIEGVTNKVKIYGTWFEKHLVMPTGEEVDAGIKNLKTWWEVKGEWLKDDDLEGVMVGSLIAGKNNIKIGDTISVKGTNETKKLTVRGIINSGGDDDEAIYTVLKTTQDLFGLEDKITMIEVSALTTPDNDLAKKAAQDGYKTAMQTANDLKAVQRAITGEGNLAKINKVITDYNAALPNIAKDYAAWQKVVKKVQELDAEINVLTALIGGNEPKADIIKGIEDAITDFKEQKRAAQAAYDATHIREGEVTDVKRLIEQKQALIEYYTKTVELKKAKLQKVEAQIAAVSAE